MWHSELLHNGYCFRTQEEYIPVRIHAKDATQKAKMMLGPLVSLAIAPTSKYIAPEHKKQHQFRNNWCTLYMDHITRNWNLLRQFEMIQSTALTYDAIYYFVTQTNFRTSFHNINKFFYQSWLVKCKIPNHWEKTIPMLH